MVKYHLIMEAANVLGSMMHTVRLRREAGAAAEAQCSPSQSRSARVEDGALISMSLDRRLLRQPSHAASSARKRPRSARKPARRSTAGRERLGVARPDETTTTFRWNKLMRLEREVEEFGAPSWPASIKAATVGGERKGGDSERAPQCHVESQNNRKCTTMARCREAPQTHFLLLHDL